MTLTRDELRRHIVETFIAGDVKTLRSSNLANITKMLNREWDYWFGLDLDRPWSADEVLEVMAKRVGIDPDGSRRDGADRIDPDLTLDALDDAAAVLAEVAREQLPVFVATGHPTGVLSIHLSVVRALAAASCPVLAPLEGTRVEGRGRIRYLGGVAMLTNGADFLHTHAAEPMHAIAESWTADGSARPGLVVADHGWAGAAAQAGLRVIGFADTNDPALFVGAEEGKVEVVVPLDDNVPPAAYEPLAAYLLAGI